MNISAVLYQIIMLFLIAGIGFFLQTKKVLTDSVVKGINSVILQAAWPAMIIMTTQKKADQETLSNFFLIVLITVVILCAASFLVFCLSKKAGKTFSRDVFTILAVMPNAGFVGLPIIQAAFGDLGLLYLAAFLVGFNLVLWTVGVCLFTGFSTKNFRCLINPGVIASVIGTVLFAFQITLPTPLLSTATQLGSLTTPLSMLLLGARMHQVSPKDLSKLRLWLSVGLKTLVMPLITLLLLRLAHIEGVLAGVIILSMAMPAASAAQIFAEKYQKDVPLAVQGITVSTLVSIITIPFILYISYL